MALIAEPWGLGLYGRYGGPALTGLALCDVLEMVAQPASHLSNQTIVGEAASKI